MQQHAVEVVELVLEHAALELVGLDGDLVAVEVEADDVDPVRADDLPRQAGHREAALLVDPLAVGLDDLGVDHALGPGAVVEVLDEEALLHADLRARPGRGPAPSYIVSTMSSTRRTSLPSMSVTSAACCLSTGSPITRIS